MIMGVMNMQGIVDAEGNNPTGIGIHADPAAVKAAFAALKEGVTEREIVELIKSEYAAAGATLWWRRPVPMDVHRAACTAGGSRAAGPT